MFRVRPAFLMRRDTKNHQKGSQHVSKIAPKVIKKTHARTNVDNISKKAAEWLPT